MNILTIGAELAAAAAAQREVEVILEPRGQADVPAVPEIAQARGGVRVVEVQHHPEAHQRGDAAGHVGIAAEVEVDLPAERHGRQDQGRRLEQAGVAVDRVDILGQVVGQRHFLEEAHEEERQAVGEVLPRDRRRSLELRQEVVGALDRPGHQLGEERDERQEAHEAALRLDHAVVGVDRVAHRLERVEGDADGQDHFGEEAVLRNAQRARAWRWDRRLGSGSCAESPKCARNAFRFSVMKPEYLK